MMALKKITIFILLLLVVLPACGGSSENSAPPPVVIAPPVVTPPPSAERPITPEAPPEGPSYHPADKGWELMWSDEFNETSVNTNNWNLKNECWGGGNDEKQCYTDRKDNIETINGVMRLVALEETFTGPNRDSDPTQSTQPYTSGKITTEGLHEWTYGRIEFRAKLPEGQGSWPAFWMLGASDVYGDTWPLYGEIDIMEAVNLGARCDECNGTDGENRTVYALHFGSLYPNNSIIDGRTHLADKSNPADNYHVWALEWGKGVIKWFLNGELYGTVRNDAWFTDGAPDNINAPYDQPFYLILNLAIGGGFPEPLNETGISDDTLPNQFLIDWVRVYQCSTDFRNGLDCMS